MPWSFKSKHFDKILAVAVHNADGGVPTTSNCQLQPSQAFIIIHF